MKIKVYIPISSITYGAKDDCEAYSNIVYGGIFTSRDAAERHTRMIDSNNTRITDCKPDGYMPGIVRIAHSVKEEVIDTDDHDEYNPDYLVTFTVRETRTVNVVITPDQIETAGYEIDEEGASLTAESLFEDGEFEYEIKDADSDDIDFISFSIDKAEVL